MNNKHKEEVAAIKAKAKVDRMEALEKVTALFNKEATDHAAEVAALKEEILKLEMSQPPQQHAQWPKADKPAEVVPRTKAEKQVQQIARKIGQW